MTDTDLRYQIDQQQRYVGLRSRRGGVLLATLVIILLLAGGGLFVWGLNGAPAIRISIDREETTRVGDGDSASDGGTLCI